MKRDLATAAGGNWPVMLTPFNSDKSIDWHSLNNLIDWYLAAGCSGLFAVCQSSEMFELTDEERLQVAGHVVARVEGRVPVIATGTFSEVTDEQVRFINKIYDTGVTAVVTLTNFFAKADQSDQVWIENMKRLVAKTGDIPLGIYECPVPYKRLLSAETVAWAVKSGKIFWSKDTSENIDQIRTKLKIIQGSNLSLYNAHIGSLLESLQAGVAGFSGIDSNYYPRLYTWMCENWEREPKLAEELQQFFNWGRMTIDVKYPRSAKHYLMMLGVIEGSDLRLKRDALNKTEIENLDTLRRQANGWLERLGLVNTTSNIKKPVEIEKG